MCTHSEPPQLSIALKNSYLLILPPLSPSQPELLCRREQKSVLAQQPLTASQQHAKLSPYGVPLERTEITKLGNYFLTFFYNCLWEDVFPNILFLAHKYQVIRITFRIHAFECPDGTIRLSWDKNGNTVKLNNSNVNF